jgi:CheY-like chemotaxis protein
LGGRRTAARAPHGDRGTRLRILHLEDDAADSALVETLLRKGGFDCELVRVEAKADFEAALATGAFQVVLSDYSIPGLRRARGARPVSRAGAGAALSVRVRHDR